MLPYLKYFATCFKGNFAYRFDYLLGIVNTVVQTFIYVAVWKSLYSGRDAIGEVSFAMVVTNFILSVGVANVFWIDDLGIQRKIRKGEITNELLKPVSFAGLAFAESLGRICSRLVTNFLPSLAIAALFLGMLPPASAPSLALALASLCLGFLILYGLSYLVSLTAFWITNVWSLSTIKNVFVSVLSGAIMPLWFMPERIRAALAYTPFDSIYFVPVSLYLGKISGAQVAYAFAKQLACIACLYGIAAVVQRRAVRRLVVQGG